MKFAGRLKLIAPGNSVSAQCSISDSGHICAGWTVVAVPLTGEA